MMKTTWFTTTAALTLLFAYTATSAPVTKECTGIDILYPKEGASFSKSERETIYLILGNKAHDARLDKVSLINPSDNTEIGDPVWTMMDEKDRLSKVMVLQQDLKPVEDSSLPEKFSFRIQVEQDEKQCIYESPLFELTQ
ncbi:hypothetical protein BDA99DRAFT_523980 [Phascolomyces articulosus]|uniref:Uncharacterized protein n=1 Tax=Phascolomyces articulosus TaxID=60185 RepID=A0AAD5K1F4_9FUNG|nr:hypothetical protein BDA99DRAFT_523980 [Phascolomyces articulosus]